MAIGTRHVSDTPAPPSGRGKVISLAFFRTDDELTAAFRAGRSDAQAELYRRHRGRIASVLHRVTGCTVDLDRLVWRTFVRAFAESRAFRGSREALEPWLICLAVQEARAHVQRQSWGLQAWRSWRRQRADAAVAALARPEQLEELQRFYAVVGHLRSSLRIPFLLELLDEMSVPEIAEACQTTMLSVKRTLDRAQQEFARWSAQDPVIVSLLHSGESLAVTESGALEESDWQLQEPASEVHCTPPPHTTSHGIDLASQYNLAGRIRKLQDELRAGLSATPDDTRLHELVSGERKRITSRRRNTWLGGAATLTVLAAVGFVAWPRAQVIAFTVDGAPGAPNRWISASASLPVSVGFSDGSHVGLAPGCRARVADLEPQGARVILETGRADLDVASPLPAHWFVSVGPFEASVADSHFTVQWDPDGERLELAVNEGQVHIAGPVIGEGRTLETGQGLVVSLPEQRATLATLPGSTE